MNLMCPFIRILKEMHAAKTKRRMTGSAGRTNQRGTPNARGDYVKMHGGCREEEYSEQSPVTGSCAARISSDTAQDVQEEATPDAYLPPGWIKVEPDW